MPAKLVRSPNNFVLIAIGIALLVVALRAGMAAANHYQIPVDRVGGKAVAVVLSCTRDAILGTALLIVAIRRSRFAGNAAVIVATILMFSFVLTVTIELVTFASIITWSDAIHLVIAAGLRHAIDLAVAMSLIASILFPWNGTFHKPMFFWMAVTIASAALLLGSLAILARL